MSYSATQEGGSWTKCGGEEAATFAYEISRFFHSKRMKLISSKKFGQTDLIESIHPVTEGEKNPKYRPDIELRAFHITKLGCFCNNLQNLL